MRRIFTFLLAALSTLSSIARACPAVLFELETVPRLKGARKGLRLFALDASSQKFHAVPLQVDPLDSEGHLKFNIEPHYTDHEVDNDDFMTFRVEDFGAPADFKKAKLPCRGRPVFELRDPSSGRVAYLTNCGSFGDPLVFPSLVDFKPEKDYLESPVYRYRFNPDNYMQFESINFRDAVQGTWETIAEHSALMIHADVKNFFSMNFDAHEIESHLEAHRLGPIGDLARLSFFLKILFFKIKMSLSTDVGFYENSSHIPMMVNIPVDASKYLNPGSGILYTWILSPTAQKAPRKLAMPSMNTTLIKKGWQELAKEGQKFCVKDVCTFRYTVEIAGKTMSMDLELERKLVARGFFPIYVEDARPYREPMGWNFDIGKDDLRTGMYFEVSGLSAGGHPWDFWLRLGGPATASASCPAPLHFEEVKDSRF